MAEERKVKRWITVNGNHVPIYEDTKDWMSADMRARYSTFIDRPDLYDRLDSDERTWVEALRAERIEEQQSQKERQIEQAKAQADVLNNKEDKLKPWSKAEQKRTEEISKKIHQLYNAGESFAEYYDTDGEDVYTQTLSKEEYGFRDGTEATITKEWFIYAQNWDENDRRVKKGKRVTDSTFYTVGIDGEILDENVLGYKTFADAKHALDLELDWFRQRERKSRESKK